MIEGARLTCSQWGMRVVKIERYPNYLCLYRFVGDKQAELGPLLRLTSRKNQNRECVAAGNLGNSANDCDQAFISTSDAVGSSTSGNGSSSSTNFFAASNFNEGCRGNLNLPRQAKRVANQDKMRVRTEKNWYDRKEAR